MPFVLSQSQALSDGLKLDLSLNAPLRPLIIGPKAGLHRYAVSAEKTAMGSLGAYNPASNQAFSWPGRDSSSIIDLNYTKLALTMENANLRYYTKAIGVNGVITPDPNRKNRIISDTLNFATFGAFPSSSVFGDRGVKVGDVVKLTATVASVVYTLTTTVTGFTNNVVSGSLGAATSDAGNVATVSGSSSQSQSSGANNWVQIKPSTGVDTSLYNGAAARATAETYTVTVTTPGAPGVALFSLGSSSGTDNATNQSFASAYDTYTSIGTRGLRVIWNVDNARPVDGGQPTNTFVVGQTWTINVTQAHTAAVPTSGGTYTGTASTSYVATVTRGGPYNSTLLTPVPVANPAVTPSASGGTLADATYWLKITYTGAVSGETNSTAAATSGVVVGGAGNGSLSIANPAATAPTGSANWKIYISNSGSGGTYWLQGTTRAFGASPVVITSFTGSGTQLPTLNSALYTAANTSPPQITITTTTGVDASGPTNVTATNTFVNIGNFGAQIKFSQTELVKGDIYYVPVIGPGQGAYQTLILKNDLGTNLALATDIAVEFYIPFTTLNIPQFSVVSPYGANWVSTLTTFTVNSGIVAFSPDWTVSGVLTALPVVSATAMYVTYREWVSGGSGVVGLVQSVSDVTTNLGTVDPDNPVSFGAYQALRNTPYGNGLSTSTALSVTNQVGYIVLAGDPTQSATWSAALTLVSGIGVGSVYSLVPMSTDPTVLPLITANVTAESSDAEGNYRTAYLPTTAVTSLALVNQAIAGQVVLATLTQNPAVVTTSYTLLSVTPTNVAKFITRGVAAGDTVRYQYGTDVYGNVTFNTYTVSSVLSEDSLLLTAGPVAAVTTAVKTEVWHANTSDQVVTALLATAASYNNKRIQLVWPDSSTLGGVAFPSYYWCASLAGLAGALPAHQSLTNVEVRGADTDTRANFFSNQQLANLAAGGVWLLRQTAAGTFYTRKAVTTSQSGVVNNTEEVGVRVQDTFSYAVLGKWSKYSGNANATTSLFYLMQSDFNSLVEQIKTRTYIQRLGSMVRSATLTSLDQSPTQLDTALASITVQFPNPLNQVVLTLTV